MSCLLQLFSNNFEYSLLCPCLSNVVGTLHPFVIRSQMFPLLFLGKIMKLKVALIDERTKRRHKDMKNKVTFLAIKKINRLHVLIKVARLLKG